MAPKYRNILVIGATGAQGSSVIDALLSYPDVWSGSNDRRQMEHGGPSVDVHRDFKPRFEFHILAVTRNPDSESARRLLELPASAVTGSNGTNDNARQAKLREDRRRRIHFVKGDPSNATALFKEARRVAAEAAAVKAKTAQEALSNPRAIYIDPIHAMNDKDELYGPYDQGPPYICSRPLIWGVYLVLPSLGPGISEATEVAQGKSIIDQALHHNAAGQGFGIRRIVYSSVDRGGDTKSWSNPTPIPHFRSKHKIEHYLVDRVAEIITSRSTETHTNRDDKTPGWRYYGTVNSSRHHRHHHLRRHNTPEANYQDSNGHYNGSVTSSSYCSDSSSYSNSDSDSDSDSVVASGSSSVYSGAATAAAAPVPANFGGRTNKTSSPKPHIPPPPSWTILRPVAYMDRNLTPGFATKVFLTALRRHLSGSPSPNDKGHGKGKGKEKAIQRRTTQQWVSTRDIGIFAAKAFSSELDESAYGNSLHEDKWHHRAMGLAGDELDFKEMDEVFRRATGGKEKGAPSTFGFLGAAMTAIVGGELRTMLQWFGEEGYGVNVDRCRAEWPGMLGMEGWLRERSGFDTSEGS